MDNLPTRKVLRARRTKLNKTVVNSLITAENEVTSSTLVQSGLNVNKANTIGSVSNGLSNTLATADYDSFIENEKLCSLQTVRITRSRKFKPSRSDSPKKSNSPDNDISFLKPTLVNDIEDQAVFNGSTSAITNAKKKRSRSNEKRSRKKSIRQSARVDVAQDDDNLSTEPSSAEEVNVKSATSTAAKKVGKMKKKKKKTHASKTSRRDNKSHEKKMENDDPNVYRTNNEEKSVRNDLPAVEDSNKENKSSVEAEASPDLFADADKLMKLPQKIENRRSTYELEHPSILLLNSPLASILDSESKADMIHHLNRSETEAAAAATAEHITSATPKRVTFDRAYHSPTKRIKFASANEEEPTPKQSSDVNRNKLKIFTPLPLSEKKSKTPMSNTSTPYVCKNQPVSLIKKVLTKDKRSATIANFMSPSKTLVNVSNISTGKGKTPSRTKMPNFALIHKQANERLENIEEYRKRKQERAMNLLSGCKSSTLKKELRKSSSANAILTTATSKKQLSYPQTSSVPKKVKTPQNDVQAKAKLPVKGFNRFGFKLVDNKEDLKISVSNKVRAPPIVKKPAVKREILKGVRSNRRFELLMQMRKNNAEK